MIFGPFKLFNTEINLVRSIQLQVLKETCAVFRHLILDDDLRVEFSESHKHAKTIAENVLVELTQLLPSNTYFICD